MGFRGYHSKQRQQLTTIERLRTNTFGVYEEIIANQGYSKLVTFFPDAWTEEIIQAKADEAYLPENRVSTHERGFVGKTSEGVLIAFWFNYDNTTNNYEAICYPLIETITAQP